MKVLSLVFLLLLTSCTSPRESSREPLRVHQKHLDAWKGKPIEALETHTWYLTRPLVKSKTRSGTEIWHYYDGKAGTSCNSQGNIKVQNSLYMASAQYQSWVSCVATKFGCNSLFFIKNNIIQKYEVTGSCYTSKVHLPQSN